MTEKTISNSNSDGDFVICVQKRDPDNGFHIIIHPVLLVCNKNGEPYTSPESVIAQFKLIGSFQNSKIISISKNQVSKKYWNMLKDGVKDSEIRDLGIEIGEEVLYT